MFPTAGAADSAGGSGVRPDSDGAMFEERAAHAVLMPAAASQSASAAATSNISNPAKPYRKVTTTQLAPGLYSTLSVPSDVPRSAPPAPPGRFVMVPSLRVFGPPRKKQKTAKTKASSATNWFEKLTVEDLKKLCKAALLPVSGTKAMLVSRLLEGERSSRFAYEYSPRRFTFRDFQSMGGYGSCDDGDYDYMSHKKPQKGAGRSSGLSVDELKRECRDQGLLVSGKRFDLVLRLLQNETSEETGIKPKQASGTFDEDGKFKPKPRAKSMKLPNAEKLRDRMYKKAYPSEEEFHKWSNNMHKYHCDRCVRLTMEMITKEIVNKQLFDRGEQSLAWKIITDIIPMWTHDNVTGMGRCEYQLKHELYPTLIKFLGETPRDVLDENNVGQVLLRLFHYAREYSVADDALKDALHRFFPGHPELERLSSESHWATMAGVHR